MNAREFFGSLADRVERIRREAHDIAEGTDIRLHLPELEKTLARLVRDLDENVDDAIQALTTENANPKTKDD